MINSTWGLGESLVSGKVTPDTWVVNKADSGIKDRYIGEKGTMTVLEEGGTAEIRVPRAQREAAEANGKKKTKRTRKKKA